MKPQYQDIITLSAKVCEEHNDMEFGSIKQHIAELQSKFEIAQEEIWDRENECADDLEDLAKAEKAIEAVRDAAEYHTGGLAQL